MQHDFWSSLIGIPGNLPQLLEFYFSQIGLKIEFCGYRRLCSDHRQRQGIRKEYVQFTDQEGWTSTVQSGMTIVMSVVITQEAKETTATKYQCPFCDCLNSLKVNNGKASIDW